MRIEQILEKIKNSAEQPRITIAGLCGGDEEEFDNDILLSPEECKILYEYIEKLKGE